MREAGKREVAVGEAVVIGVGNRLRRDDGVGLVVVDHLQGSLPPDTRVLASEHVPPDLYELWDGANQVFLVDAAASGAVPGTVRRFDAGSTVLPAVELRLSTHGFGLAQAIALARALGRLPDSLTVYAIEGAELGDGEGLSAAVADAAATVAGRIRSELLESLAREARPGSPGDRDPDVGGERPAGMGQSLDGRGGRSVL